MIRLSKVLLLAAGFVLATAPTFAQTADTQHQVRKAAKSKAGKPRKAAAVPPAPASGGGINTPSTDFSKIERADEEASGPNGPTFRPTMGSGGMGLGAGF